MIDVDWRQLGKVRALKWYPSFQPGKPFNSKSELVFFTELSWMQQESSILTGHAEQCSCVVQLCFFYLSDAGVSDAAFDCVTYQACMLHTDRSDPATHWTVCLMEESDREKGEREIEWCSEREREREREGGRERHRRVYRVR